MKVSVLVFFDTTTTCDGKVITSAILLTPFAFDCPATAAHWFAAEGGKVPLHLAAKVEVLELEVRK